MKNKSVDSSIDDNLPEAEIVRRREDTLKRMLETPPKKHSTISKRSIANVKQNGIVHEN